MLLFRAHQASSGKSYLADVISTMTRGQVCPVITNAKSTEEMEKRLGAFVLEGVPMISIDNCSSNLGGDLLCQVTERRLVRIRILGRSQLGECEWRGVLFGTGNNIGYEGDMTRRGLQANLDAQVERPELRTFSFNPIERVLANRGAYVAAALTIARAYFAAGSPSEVKPLASYGEWTTAVRAPLIWLGKEDPVKSMETAREEDPVRSAARNLVALWRQHLKLGIGYTATQIIKIATEQTRIDGVIGDDVEWKNPELHDLLLQQTGTPNGRIEPRTLGNWLMSIRGQIHNGHRIMLVKEGNQGNRYALEAVTAK
jgi:putative DNA primase/helicase